MSSTHNNVDNRAVDDQGLDPQEAKGSSSTRDTYTVADLIKEAKKHPPKPVIEGLLCVGDVCVIHGEEESFKSALVLQIAESIATGKPLLRRWQVPKPRRVGIVETELHPAQLGNRFGVMFGASPPKDLLIYRNMRDFRNQMTLSLRVDLISIWAGAEKLEVHLVDTANDFFRGDQAKPNDETVVASFFERLRRSKERTWVLVRHDHKPSAEDATSTNANNRIRGSAEWKEDPELILYLRRPDRRVNTVVLEVGKLRYGAKPAPLELWFDAGTLRLTPLPPAIALLEAGPLPRQRLITLAKDRFGLSQRKLDKQLAEFRPFLKETREGHAKFFEIDWPAVSHSDEEDDHDEHEWRRLVRQPGSPREICNVETEKRDEAEERKEEGG